MDPVGGSGAPSGDLRGSRCDPATPILVRQGPSHGQRYSPPPKVQAAIEAYGWDPPAAKLTVADLDWYFGVLLHELDTAEHWPARASRREARLAFFDHPRIAGYTEAERNEAADKMSQWLADSVRFIRMAGRTELAEELMEEAVRAFGIDALAMGLLYVERANLARTRGAPALARHGVAQARAALDQLRHRAGSLGAGLAEAARVKGAHFPEAEEALREALAELENARTRWLETNLGEAGRGLVYMRDQSELLEGVISLHLALGDEPGALTTIARFGEAGSLARLLDSGAWDPATLLQLIPNNGGLLILLPSAGRPWILLVAEGSIVAIPAASKHLIDRARVVSPVPIEVPRCGRHVSIPDSPRGPVIP